MSRRKPFTLIAAALLGLIAVGHAYRIANQFQVIVGTHDVPQSASWIALIVSAGLSFMLLREAKR